MPQNLSDSPFTWPTPVTAPSDGDPENAASVVTPLQSLTSRTANAKLRLDNLCPWSGATYSPPLPSGTAYGASPLFATNLTTLASIPAANRQDGMMVQVYADALYQYDAASSATVLAPYVIAPADSVGRWIRQGYAALGVANGLPQLDGSARLLAATQRLTATQDTYVQVTSVTTAAAGDSVTYANVAGAVITFPVNTFSVGDTIRASVCGYISNLTSSANALLAFRFSLQSGATPLSFGTWQAPSTSSTPFSLSSSHTVASGETTGAGTSSVQVCVAAAGSSSQNINLALLELNVRVIRP